MIERFAMPGLAFDEASHTYRWHGTVVPGVTKVIAPLSDWSGVDGDVLERARLEGTATHKMVELDVRGDLDPRDPASLPAWLRPRHFAWRKFLMETGFVPRISENPLYSQLYRYAGTPDLYGEIARHGIRNAVIDVKRSFYGGRIIGLQTAAYVQLLKENFQLPQEPFRRYALQLMPDGNYRLVEYANANDVNVFLACLTVHNFLETNK